MPQLWALQQGAGLRGNEKIAASDRDGLPTFLQVLFCAPFQIFFRGWSSGSLFDVGAADCAPKRGVLGRIFADGIPGPAPVGQQGTSRAHRCVSYRGTPRCARVPPVDYGDGPSIAGMRSQLAPGAVAPANHAAAFFFSMTEESNRVLFSSMAQAT